MQFLFQLVIGCQNARKKSPERQILRLSGEEESGHFSGEEELEDTTHHNNARGKLMQKPETENSNSRAGSSSGHSSGHMSHRNEITSGTYTHTVWAKIRKKCKLEKPQHCMFATIG